MHDVSSHSKSGYTRDDYCIISNPRAGGRSKEHLLQTIRDSLAPARCLFLNTSPDGSAFSAIADARALGLRRFVAVGGDGTIQAIAPHLNSPEETLGLIMAGSGNGFAAYFGYRRNIRQNLDVLIRNEIKTVDTLQVNGRPFVNLAGVGFDARVAAEVRTSQKRGFQAYLLAVIRMMSGPLFWKGSVVLDETRIQGEFLTVVVANAAIFGYGFRIARYALADDGLMTVVLVNRVAIWRYILAIPLVLTGMTRWLSWMTEHTASEVRIIPDDATPLQADGELFPTAPDYTFQIEPRSLALITA